MPRLTVSRHLGQCDTEMVKYERYKFGIEGSVGLHWIQTARQCTPYLQPSPHPGNGQGVLLQFHASAMGIPYSLHEHGPTMEGMGGCITPQGWTTHGYQNLCQLAGGTSD